MSSASALTVPPSASFTIHRWGEPAPEELLLGPVVYGLRQMLDAVLIAPGVVDNQAALVLAEIQVRVVDVAGCGDPLTLGLCELRIGDFPILVGCPASAPPYDLPVASASSSSPSRRW